MLALKILFIQIIRGHTVTKASKDVLISTVSITNADVTASAHPYSFMNEARIAIADLGS